MTPIIESYVCNSIMQGKERTFMYILEPWT